jgi:hypothetical protein
MGKMHKTLGALLVLLAACTGNQQEQSSPPATAIVTDSVQQQGQGSLTPQPVPPADIPLELRQPGQLLEGWRWTDGNGENLLVVFRSVLQ